MLTPFEIPTFGIANTDPCDMTDENFAAWLECIPEKRREEWQNRYKYQLPKTHPAPNAVLIDWRFQAYTLDMYEYKDKTIGEKYAHAEIDPTQKIKGRKKNETILFAIRIPKPAEVAPC